MSQVVVGFDGSEPAQHALAWAAEEARLRTASLHVVQSWKEPVLAGPVGIDLWTDPGALVREVTEAFEASVAELMAAHPAVEFSAACARWPRFAPPCRWWWCVRTPPLTPRARCWLRSTAPRAAARPSPGPPTRHEPTGWGSRP